MFCFRYLIKYKKNTKILDKIKTVYNDYCLWYMNSKNCDSQNTRQHWQRLVHQYKDSGADIVSFFCLYKKLIMFKN